MTPEQYGNIIGVLRVIAILNAFVAMCLLIKLLKNPPSGKTPSEGGVAGSSPAALASRQQDEPCGCGNSRKCTPEEIAVGGHLGAKGATGEPSKANVIAIGCSRDRLAGMIEFDVPKDVRVLIPSIRVEYPNGRHWGDVLDESRFAAVITAWRESSQGNVEIGRVEVDMDKSESRENISFQANPPLATPTLQKP